MADMHLVAMQERLKSLGHVVQQARSAFGSIIPIDRAAVLLGGTPQAPPPETLKLTPAHAFLVLGVAHTSGAFEVADIVSNVHRWTPFSPCADFQPSTSVASWFRHLLCCQEVY